MKIRSRLRNLHVYQKVIAVFVLLIIPGYCIHLWMNGMSQTYIKEGLSNTIESNVKFYARQLDDQIAFIRNLQLQLLLDSDLQKFSFLANRLDHFEETQLVNRVRERLSAINNSSSYLENVGVYIKSFGRTISTSRGVMQLPNAELDIIHEFYNKQPSSSLYFHGDRLFFIEASNNDSIVAYMELSIDRVKETLSGLVTYSQDTGAFLTDWEFEHIISLQPQESIIEGIRQTVSRENESYPPSDESYLLDLDKESYKITYNRISTLGLNLYTYANQNELTRPLKVINNWFFVLSLVSLVIILIFSFSVNWMIHKPLKKLIQAFKVLETDNLHLSVRSPNDKEFGYLYRSFDRMVEKLQHSIQENYQQTIALQHSELKQLQSQINPHFLYNSFFNIYMICRSGDVDSAAELAQRLGSYYQFITRSGADEVPLDLEYRHGLDYCDIQSIRFSNRVAIQTDELPDGSQAIMVPRLIIQPVLENVFEHSFEQGVRRGHLEIHVRLEKEELRIQVEDDGEQLTDEALQHLQEKLANASQVQEKSGLINVCSRIRLKFGEGSGVFVSRSDLGGLKAEIVIRLS